MRPLDAKYVAQSLENKWYSYWLANGFFNSIPDNRESYTVVIPPPNVTGVLHMGHMLNNTIQDVLVRKARLQGKNACWVPGTDHASIATEAKVVAKLKADGIDKNALSREEFLTHAWAWTDKHGGIILEQLKKLGASCDWDRTAFTMDEVRYTSVIKVFLDLYNKGKIYRGYRMVNWDPEAQTTVSDEEVLHKEVAGKLYYVRYFVEGSTTEYISVATTRPETILGDVAICVNPNDERYANMIGKKVLVPIANRLVPIIADDYVDAAFGTGALKITPAHDINDYNIGEKHKLEVIDVLDATGKLNAHGLHYAGKDRFVARKMIAKELEEIGNLIKVEEYQSSVGTSERTGAVIEPRLSMQWFLAMEELSAPALENVVNGNIQFYPPKFVNTYKYWMENVRDWCISRQLYWGHRIPAWYFGTGREDFVVAESAESALKLAIAKTGKDLKADDLRQDEDVLDTWFSSWLWPLAVFDGINNPNNEEVNYYYPTKALVTAPEILFFWVARMIIAGYEYAGQKPFDAVYLTGIVRDKLGRKMSKSLGNSPDPIDLIEKYGADGVRVGMLMSSPAGNDLPFDEDLCKQGSFFANKVWNATRLVTGWEVSDAPQPETAKIAVLWFTNQLQKSLAEINDSFEKYRMSEALTAVYKLVWNDYCSWYLEMIKPPYGEAIDKTTLAQTLDLFEELLKLMHPFMPFITEEIWQSIREREANSTIMLETWPAEKTFDPQILTQFAYFEEVVTGIRNIRKEKNIAQKEALNLSVLAGANHHNLFAGLVKNLCNISQISDTTTEVAGAFSFSVGATGYFIPASGLVDVPQELARIEKEIVYQQGFLQSVMKKLGNEKFVASAPPAVVAVEQKKREDAEANITALTEQYKALAKG